MRIKTIRATPLFIPYKEAYHWSQGVMDGAEVVLIEVTTEDGLVGIGESMSGPDAGTMAAIVRHISARFIGRSPYEITRLTAEAYRAYFASGGTGSAPRFAAQALAGLELALWDLVGKAAGQPVYRLLGGAVHDTIGYFGFLQGDTAEDLARDARRVVDEGCSVVYMKVGRGAETDLENVQAVRQVIGARRLRLDANEVWDVLTALNTMAALESCDPEFFEQPTPSDSLSALAQVRARTRVPIAVDQAAFSPADVYEVCRQGLADLIVLGLHETGGIQNFKKAASIAEAAGVNVCLHGLHETGITTCAANQVAATIPNLDDGNQIMVQLLAEDILASPNLQLREGRLPVVNGAGLGFELDADAVTRAKERFEERAREGSTRTIRQ